MEKKKPVNGKILICLTVIMNFISLEGKYSYMFPKKSMSEKEYSLLKKTLKDNINQQ
jgi:hypothetical protein